MFIACWNCCLRLSFIWSITLLYWIMYEFELWWFDYELGSSRYLGFPFEFDLFFFPILSFISPNSSYTVKTSILLYFCYFYWWVLLSSRLYLLVFKTESFLNPPENLLDELFLMLSLLLTLIDSVRLPNIFPIKLKFFVFYSSWSIS